MGMDVYGLKPKTVVGEYFRNNIWSWHPLWDYCCFVDNTLVEKVPMAHSNDGDGLNAVDSRQLGFKLIETIESGLAASYILTYDEHVKSLQKEPCYCTKPSNIETFETTLQMFLTSIAEAQNYPTNLLQESYDSTGPIPFPKQKDKPQQKNHPPKNDCASCQGTGLVDNFLSNYPLNINNIELFGKFLIDCGGFRIC